MNRFRAVALGASAGGREVLHAILSGLSADFPAPILVVQHRGPDSGEYLARNLDAGGPLRVKEADEKEMARPGVVYLAPANYHLLAERDGALSLSVEARIHFSRPSIDVLLETAADAWGPALAAGILTGANRDGARGLRRVADRGGTAFVQDPDSAESPEMPRAARLAVPEAHVLPPEGIAPFLTQLFQEKA
ncbi:MAG: chemotaxis protein CheB [Desulfococcaceae bacterium]